MIKFKNKICCLEELEPPTSLYKAKFLVTKRGNLPHLNTAARYTINFLALFNFLSLPCYSKELDKIVVIVSNI